MHEISLIQALLDTVLDSAGANGIRRVDKVKLVVGELHGALPEALVFAFEVLTRDTLCAGAALEVEKSPLVFRCAACHRDFTPVGPSRCCLHCGGADTALVRGRELYIDYYEGE